MTTSPLAAFVQVSATLTGFTEGEIYGTGQARVHLDELTAIVGDDMVARLLAWSGADIATLKASVLPDPDLGPLMRNVTVMWYLGQWDVLPSDWRNRNGASPLDTNRVLSAAGYQEGLVWPAVGAHPMGAKPTGYGSWALPPEPLT